MDTSDLIAGGALVAAVAAIGLGEWRAWRERRSRSERNIVDWVVGWPSPEGFQIKSNGPDEARGVLAEVWAEYGKGETIARRVRRGDGVIVPMPHMVDLWNDTPWEEESGTGRRVNVVEYRIRLTWKTPSGARQSWVDSSTIQTWHPTTVNDLFEPRPSVI